MQRLADELIGNVRPVELSGVNVIHPEFDGAPEHGQRLVVVAGRPERSGTGQLDCAETDAPDGITTSGKVSISAGLVTLTRWRRFRRRCGWLDR